MTRTEFQFSQARGGGPWHMLRIPVYLLVCVRLFSFSIFSSILYSMTKSSFSCLLSFFLYTVAWLFILDLSCWKEDSNYRLYSRFEGKKHGHFHQMNPGTLNSTSIICLQNKGSTSNLFGVCALWDDGPENIFDKCHHEIDKKRKERRLKLKKNPSLPPFWILMLAP